jgi:anti-sigma factor RsiW
MKDTFNHPADFSAYLDRDTSDSRYDEIRGHIERCARCRDEVGILQSMDAMFRSADRVEVPSFQWQRIAAQIQAGPSDRLAPLWRLLEFRKPVWSAAVATLVLVVALMAGLSYHKNSEQKQLLIAISRYVSVAESKTGPEENPFQVQIVADHTNERNPFDVRR